MTTTRPARAPVAPAPTESWSSLLRQVLRPLPSQEETETSEAATEGEPESRRRARTSVAPLQWG
ncbi:MAG: hypothetical protein AB7K71_14830 [Polyangiaceae bacterium]